MESGCRPRHGDGVERCDRGRLGKGKGLEIEGKEKGGGGKGGRQVYGDDFVGCIRTCARRRGGGSACPVSGSLISCKVE